MNSNNAIVEKQKVDFGRGLRTVTKLYSCTIIDVHPEKLTVDVVITRNSKLIEGVLIGSSFLGRDCANITIPERNTEAILASTEDSNPFIVAYRPTRSYKSNGYFGNELQEGEVQTSYSGQAFKKCDAYGGMYKSSSNADWIIVSDAHICDETSARTISAIDSIEMIVSEYDMMSKSYEYNDLKDNSELMDEVINTSNSLIDLTIKGSGDSIYNLLAQISEDNIDETLLSQINDKINAFLAKKDTTTSLNLTKKGIGLNSGKISINDTDFRLFLKDFISTRTTSNIEKRIVDGVAYNATKTTEIFVNSTNNKTLYTLITFTFDDIEGYKEEELQLPTGEVYLKKTWTNHYVDGRHYDTYSEVTNKNLYTES